MTNSPGGLDPGDGGAAGVLSPPQADFLAHHHRDRIVFAAFRRATEAERAALEGVPVLASVVRGAAEAVADAGAGPSWREEAFAVGREAAGRLVEFARAHGARSRDLFAALLRWGQVLEEGLRLPEALAALREADVLGLRRYPALFAEGVHRRAKLSLDLGEADHALAAISALALRPYLLEHAETYAEVLETYASALLLRGEAEAFKRALVGGLGLQGLEFRFRRRFADRLDRCYGGRWSFLADANLTGLEKALFWVIRTFGRIRESRPVRAALPAIKALRLQVPGKAAVLGLAALRERASGSGPRRHILVTRAMGGIGDLLMMTPGFRALREKHPEQEVHLAIPKGFFPLFEGNCDVRLLDIEGDAIDVRAYRKWVNLTDCPAARVEGKTAPHVPRNRIEIFAGAMGVSRRRLVRSGPGPRYFVSDEDRRFRDAFWREKGFEGRRVVGVHLYSADSYKDYPGMPELVEALARDGPVLLFHGEKIEGYEHAGVWKVDSLPLRRSFALAAGCDVLVAPDSAFIHFAGALGIPCVALYGPTDGRLFTKYYPRCRVVDARGSLGCVPCWRNEDLDCRLTESRSSACMRSIPVPAVLGAVRGLSGDRGSS